MDVSKAWWQSKTIWTGFLGGLWAVLRLCNVIEFPVDTALIDQLVGFALSSLTIYFRTKSTHAIVAVPPKE